MNGEKRFLPFPVAWHASSPPSKKRDFFAPRRRPAAFRFFIFLCLLKFTFKGGVLYCSSFDIFHLPRRRVTVHKNRLDTLLGQREPHHVDEDELTMGAVSLHRESQNRRKALFTIASCIMVPSCVNAASSDSLVDLELGRGQWSKLDRNAGSMAAPTTKLVNPSFCTYATRFLIHYDEGFASWWSSVVYKYSLLPADERLSKLGQAFGSLARSVQIGTGDFLAAQRQPKDGIVQLYDLFKDKYGEKDDADRQIALLFSLLDDDLQPTEKLRQAATVTIPASQSNPVADITVSSLLNEEASMLLPERYHCAKVQDSALFTIDPPIALFEIGIDEEFGQTATATAFGPLAYSPLTREIPVYSPEMYALFGISGAAGCAITHSFVIPLDVVKTRNQVDPEQYSDFFGSAVSIFKNEGMKGLLLGAQATVAGYFWYGKLGMVVCRALFSETLANVCRHCRMQCLPFVYFLQTRSFAKHITCRYRDSSCGRHCTASRSSGCCSGESWSYSSRSSTYPSCGRTRAISRPRLDWNAWCYCW